MYSQVSITVEKTPVFLVIQNLVWGIIRGVLDVLFHNTVYSK